MAETTIKCAACGHPATGKFCNSCGAPLASTRCKQCEAQLSAGARFCHLCGTPTAAGSAKQATSFVTGNAGWIAAGLAAVALVVVVGVQLLDRNPPPPAMQTAPALAPGRATTDISNMTPRERADRLFERIMIADSRGFPDTVAFFTPMALQAYALLGTPDIDARYHIGLIESLAGNTDAVRAQADSIRAEDPRHLMAPMLDVARARLGNDSSAMLAAYREFLANYPSEIGMTRNEYAAHQTALESFRQDAEAATGGSGS